MEFDPDDHDTQPVVESKPRRRLISPISTAIFVFLALIVWLASGVLFNTETVEAAFPLPKLSWRVGQHDEQRSVGVVKVDGLTEGVSCPHEYAGSRVAHVLVDDGLPRCR